MTRSRIGCLSDALDFVESYPVQRTEQVRLPVAEAVGHRLADAVTAPGSLPRFDCAAMDGFAIRTVNASEGAEVSLRVSQTITAGMIGQPVRKGEAARIFTGARMPPDADCVVMQEDARVRRQEVTLRRRAGGRANIRPVGEDVRGGAVVL